MRPRRSSPTRWGLTGQLTMRSVDWLALAAVLALSLPSLVHAAAKGQLGQSLLVLPFATVPLLWRRRRPGMVLAVLIGALGVSSVLGRTAPSAVGVLSGLYAAALYGQERLRALSGLIAGAASAAAFGVLLVTERIKVSPHLTIVAFGAGAAWVLGERTRIRQAYLLELEDRAARLERERDAHALRAAEQERIRIARELHDVVTHHVTVIAVQAGAAHSTAHSRPDRSLAALGVIEQTARRTLGELRALLGVLRSGDAATVPAPMRPLPSLAQLDELLTSARAAGIDVDARVEGTEVPLDPVVELNAYRVLQEALTNVIKHAPGAKALVRIHYGASQLHVTVHDNGPGARGDGATGYGLIGMRERIELAGGELHAGPAATGFRLDAVLPLGQPYSDVADTNQPSASRDNPGLVNA